jgi:Concanavalin A-like lectin/glucanases superfamily
MREVREAVGVARFATTLAVLVLVALPGTAAAASSPLVHDVSGNHNDGRLGSSRSTDGRDADWVKGLFGVGTALRFDGNDYISIPDDKSLHQQRLTVEAWARRDGSPGQWKYIVSKGGDGCHAAAYGLYTSLNGGLAFYVFDGKTYWRSPQASPAIWDGSWHHVAGTYDGATVRVFVDGKEIGTGTRFKGKIKYEQPYDEGALGAYRGSCKLTFSGVVDEVRIWRAALPVSKIWSLIAGGLDREPAAPGARKWYESF